LANHRFDDEQQRSAHEDGADKGSQQRCVAKGHRRRFSFRRKRWRGHPSPLPARLFSASASKRYAFGLLGPAEALSAKTSQPTGYVPGDALELPMALEET